MEAAEGQKRNTSVPSILWLSKKSKIDSASKTSAVKPIEQVPTTGDLASTVERPIIEVNVMVGSTDRAVQIGLSFAIVDMTNKSPASRKDPIFKGCVYRWINRVHRRGKQQLLEAKREMVFTHIF